MMGLLNSMGFGTWFQNPPVPSSNSKETTPLQSCSEPNAVTPPLQPQLPPIPTPIPTQTPETTFDHTQDQTRVALERRKTEALCIYPTEVEEVKKRLAIQGMPIHDKSVKAMQEANQKVIAQKRDEEKLRNLEKQKQLLEKTQQLQEEQKRLEERKILGDRKQKVLEELINRGNSSEQTTIEPIEQEKPDVPNEFGDVLVSEKVLQRDLVNDLINELVKSSVPQPVSPPTIFIMD